MRLITAMLAITAMLGCASRVDRVVTRAGRGLAYDATYTPTPGGDLRTLKFLQQRAEWLGVIIEYRPEGHEDLQGATGLSYRQGAERHVIIAETISVNGRIEVLAHELGHLFGPSVESRTDGDVFAELVSVEVCRRLGVDSSAASGRYLGGFKTGLRVARLYRFERRYVVDLLTRGYREARHR